MMRKVLIMTLISFALMAHAQDSKRISISAYVAPNCGVPQASEKVLEGKLNNVITASGFGAELNQRFILTSRVNVLSEDVTETAPPMFVYNLSFDLYIGDGVTGTLYASTQVAAKGVGNTKEKAYLMALKSLNPRDPALKSFVEDGKSKIIDYYNTNGAAIIKKAGTMAANQQYDEALWELSAIPEACTAYYNQANDMIVSVYQQQITNEGASMLAEAQAIWNAAQDREAADRAGEILARINPQSPAYKQAQQLHSTISARIKALDAREWSFQLQQQRDATAIKKAQLSAARDVAVAWAKNQPKTVYKVYWW